MVYWPTQSLKAFLFLFQQQLLSSQYKQQQQQQPQAHPRLTQTGLRMSSVDSVSTSSVPGSDSGFGPGSSSGGGRTLSGTDRTHQYQQFLEPSAPSTAAVAPAAPPATTTSSAAAYSPAYPSSAPLAGTKPDMSYLTAEERAIIENVISRQQSEESKEVEFLR